MSFCIRSAASLALLSLVQLRSVAATPAPAATPSASSVTPAYTGPTKAVPFPGQPIYHANGTTIDSLAKRDNPNLYVWPTSYYCGDTGFIEYPDIPTSGCYYVNTFESFSPTNNPSCLIRAYANADNCDGAPYEFGGYATGQCVELVANVNGIIEGFEAYVVSIQC
jgi:hypothetical protein